MFCTKCGNQLLDEALLCPKCGTKTANYDAYMANQAPVNQQIATSPEVDIYTLLVKSDIRQTKLLDVVNVAAVEAKISFLESEVYIETSRETGAIKLESFRVPYSTLVVEYGTKKERNGLANLDVEYIILNLQGTIYSAYNIKVKGLTKAITNTIVKDAENRTSFLATDEKFYYIKNKLVR